MPLPGTFQNDIEGLKLRLPAEFPLYFFRRGNQPRRITRAPRFLHHFDFSTADFPAGIDHLSDAGASAGAEIEKITFRSAERQNVGPGEIDDVNVIANAGSIGRLVIRSKNFDAFFSHQAQL